MARGLSEKQHVVRRRPSQSVLVAEASAPEIGADEITAIALELRQSVETTYREAQKKLIAEVRQFCRLQRPLWQRVPSLALEADGRTGHNATYAIAYAHGYWLVFMGNPGGPAIDCATGEIVAQWGSIELASDVTVFTLAASLDLIDAGMIVAELQKRSDEPVGSYYSAKEKAAWREATRRNHQLGEIFTRR